MNPTLPVTDALGEERVVRMMTEIILDRSQLNSKKQTALDDPVADFFAHNVIPLSAILRNASLVSECPDSPSMMRQFRLRAQVGAFGCTM